MLVLLSVPRNQMAINMEGCNQVHLLSTLKQEFATRIILRAALTTMNPNQIASQPLGNTSS